MIAHHHKHNRSSELSSKRTRNTEFFLFSYGLVRSADSENTLYLANQPRNVASLTVQYFAPVVVKIWSGYVCPNIMNATCSNAQAIRLPPESYRIRFSALKHFGNLTNPMDFEVYYTPAFNLVY